MGIIIKLVFNAILGGLLLWIINLLGASWGIALAINPVTALIAGVLGAPGIALLLVLRYFLL